MKRYRVVFSETGDGGGWRSGEGFDSIAEAFDRVEEQIRSRQFEFIDLVDTETVDTDAAPLIYYWVSCSRQWQHAKDWQALNGDVPGLADGIVRWNAPGQVGYVSTDLEQRPWRVIR